ncbi:hypothetical protein DPMN_169388 [Dreissena polymorpha]|uniref:Uncharacterized protein n=1 Tax=Dreissena polymorpha TaxID=45954 RepID=A0A9D4DWE5_DREPO|nr:hypothetical protein DPMN_169388 [Dreissena polymorpha]
MGKDQNIKVVQIFVYQELKDSLCERNLIYCDILEPQNKTLSIPESSKEHDEIVNGIFQRVFDAILTVVELQDIGLMEWYSTSILEHNIWKGYKYVLITIQCRSETYNSVDSLQKALHAFNPVRFIDLDEVGHLMEGLKTGHMDEVVENMSDAGNYSAKRGDFTKRITPIPMPDDIDICFCKLKENGGL